MNFLQLTQDLCREADITNGAAAISTVVSQAGELDRVVNWVKDAYTEIQNRHGNLWRFMRHGFTVNTANNDDSYTSANCTDTTTSLAIDRFGSWRFRDRQDPPKIFLTSAGVGTQRWLSFVTWTNFQAIYRIGTQNTGYPVHITIDPQDNLLLGPKPNAIYTVTGEYYRSPQLLDVTDGTDSPDMPSQYHKLIVYKALWKYGMAEAAPEVVLYADAEGKKVMRQLESNQLQMPRLGGPMVT